ncbi:MAG TPA: hypothetical protein VFA52_02855 [Candidatus Paceibacterota bacterium]|nr:hypothetical protein [Candidatus Paceibacterota bacterium]
MNESFHQLAKRSNYWISVTLGLIVIILATGFLYDNLFYSNELPSKTILLIQKVCFLLGLCGFLTAMTLTARFSRVFRAKILIGTLIYLPLAGFLYYAYHQQTGCWAICFDPGLVYLGISLFLFVLIMLTAAYWQNRKILQNPASK